MGPLYDAVTPLIPLRHQPALLVEHLQSLDLDTGRLRHGTALGADDALLTPTQYLQMLRNAMQLLASPEAPFALGQQALPGHFGAASHALLRAGSLRRALQLLVAHPARLSPLLVPHFAEEGGQAALYWTDALAPGEMRAFLVDLHMSAVKAMCDWLSGERLPWRFLFNRTTPRHLEHHEVHLGSRLRFNCQLDAMLIDSALLDRPWPQARGSLSAAALDALDAQARAEDDRHSLLGALYLRLQSRLRQSPTLEDTAGAFGVSPATLKRRLAAHGTHFQAELDRVRLHAALQLMHGRGWDNRQVAEHLGIHDSTNFRRSVKRWSGLTPSLLRDAF
jgi:AraC-like DNA-binding protein